MATLMCAALATDSLRADAGVMQTMRIGLAVAFLAFAQWTAGATLYKCEKDGKTAFSETPCPEAQAKAAAPAASASASSANSAMSRSAKFIGTTGSAPATCVKSADSVRCWVEPEPTVKSESVVKTCRKVDEKVLCD